MVFFCKNSFPIGEKMFRLLETVMLLVEKTVIFQLTKTYFVSLKDWLPNNGNIAACSAEIGNILTGLNITYYFRDQFPSSGNQYPH